MNSTPPAMLWQAMIEQLVAIQRWIYGALSSDLGAFAATRDWTALTAVLPTGIVFGAVHALTPGHGKSILASYLVDHGLRPCARLLWLRFSP